MCNQNGILKNESMLLSLVSYLLICKNESKTLPKTGKLALFFSDASFKWPCIIAFRCLARRRPYVHYRGRIFETFKINYVTMFIPTKSGPTLKLGQVGSSQNQGH